MRFGVEELLKLVFGFALVVGFIAIVGNLLKKMLLRHFGSQPRKSEQELHQMAINAKAADDSPHGKNSKSSGCITFIVILVIILIVVALFVFGFHFDIGH